jgi:hypothetical protein
MSGWDSGGKASQATGKIRVYILSANRLLREALPFEPRTG